MSSRASMASGGRRGPSAFSSSLSSSQSAGTSTQPVFSFRPHVLLSHINGTNKDNLLDYRDLTDRIEMFKEVFLAESEQTISTLRQASDEQNSKLREEKRNIDQTKEAIEKQREEQKKTYQVVAAERQADSDAQNLLLQLRASQKALMQRLNDAEEEKDQLQSLLEKKLQERDRRKARLMNEVKRNKPELKRFNEKLGCRISSGYQEGDQRAPLIKFSFHLIDAEDWKYEAKFVLDVSKSKYRVLSHTPALPQEKLDVMLSELNTSRALFAFIKRMRAAFKEVVDLQRLAQKAARKLS